MTIANALREFFFKLNGVKPNGLNIAEVIRSGASNISINDDKTELFLKSSTASSTKRFAITVVDDGTITATEVD